MAGDESPAFLFTPDNQDIVKKSRQAPRSAALLSAFCNKPEDEILLTEEVLADLDEGEFHRGLGATVRLVVRKR
jgi:hypothetical protein